jgi:S1-C subfamily serine protease
VKLVTFLFISGAFMVGFGAALFYNSNPLPAKMPVLVPGLNSPDKFPPLIRLHDKKSGAFFCSGSVIGKNYIVTAAHCLEGRSHQKVSIDVRTLDGQKVKVDGTAIWYEPRSDQGLVYGDFSTFNYIDMANQTAPLIRAYMNPGNVMLACGFPYGGDVFCSTFTERHMSFFQFAGAGFLYPGMSGGPVVDASSGILVGVNTAVEEGAIIISPVVELLHHAHVKVAGEE